MFNPVTVLDQLRRIAQSDAVSQARIAAISAIKFVVRSHAAAVSLGPVSVQLRTTSLLGCVFCR